MIKVYQQADLDGHYFIVLTYQTGITDYRMLGSYTDFDKFCEAIDKLDSAKRYLISYDDLIPILFRSHMEYIKNKCLNWDFILSEISDGIIELIPKSTSSKLIERL